MADARRLLLRVEVDVRGVVDAEHAQTLAAEMIARAHELANPPECQCDVDVSVQLTGQPGAAAPGQRASETVLAPVAEGDVPSGAPAADERTAIR